MPLFCEIETGRKTCYNDTSMKTLGILLIFLLALVIPSFAAVKAPDFTLQGEGDTSHRLADYKGKTLVLFFFSFGCGHCEKAMPHVKELNKKSNGRYDVLGVVYGTQKEDLRYKKIESGTEFAIALGSQTTLKDYKVSGTPYFWVIGPDGELKERFVGDTGAGLLRDYLNAGNLTERVGLFELSSVYKEYEGKAIETGGMLLQMAPSYFPKPVFMISNGIEKVRVSPWLPLEAAPAPRGMNRPRKKVMSDFIGKKVTVTGKVVLEDGKPFIEVKSGKAVE